jgi:hypothetical protein
MMVIGVTQHLCDSLAGSARVFPIPPPSSLSFGGAAVHTVGYVHIAAACKTRCRILLYLDFIYNAFTSS